MKMMGTLALALILLGLMAWRAPAGGAFFRVLDAADLGAPVRAPRRYRQLDAGARARSSRSCSRSARRCSSGTRSSAPRYRAVATDREITATLGVPVRRVEASAWLGCGIVCGAAGLLLADLFTTLDYTALTFLPHLLARRGSDRAAALADGDARSEGSWSGSSRRR